jgi:predicted nucleotidyltransferase
MPMNTLESLRQRRAEIERLARRHGAHDVRIFGSVARGEDTELSDIDVLVEMSDEASLLDLVLLQQALETALNRRADVLSLSGINPYLRDRILAEAVRL